MVVLPAPLGPISPLTSPSAISNDALLTARRPRNDLEMQRTSSSAIGPLAREELDERHDGQDPEQRVDEQQVDADVALAAAEEARLNAGLIQGVGEPHRAGEARERPLADRAGDGKAEGGDERGEGPLDEDCERRIDEVVPLQ